MIAHKHDHNHDHDHDHGEHDHHDHNHDHHGEDHDHDHHDHDHHDHDHHGHGHHGHHHGPGGHHHHIPENFDRAFAIGITLNVVFVIIEFSYGFFADSLALIADAGHNLSDVLSLILAWGATKLASRAPTSRRTYGFRRATILASLTSAVMLLVALGAIFWEAIERFSSPQPVEGMTVIIVAGIGVVINTATALLFMRGQSHDLNIRGAFLHMAADAAISLGVVIAGIVIMFTSWFWLDPTLSVLIALVILWGTWGLLKESLNLAMDAVPSHIDPDKVQDYLLQRPGVRTMHDLHIWALSTTDVALTVHLVVDTLPQDDEFLHNIGEGLQKKFKIEHSTIQLECEGDCHLAKPDSL